MDENLENNFLDDNLNYNFDEKIMNSTLSANELPLNCGKCVTAKQFWENVFKPKICNRENALRKVNALINSLDISQFSSVMIEFNGYLVNGNYLVKKTVFKSDMLPRLQSFICSKDDETKKFYSLCLLLKLLFDEWLSKKSKLAKVVVKSSFVTKLMQISQYNTDLQSQKAIYAILSFLFFVIAYNKNEKTIKNLILNDIEVIIKSVMRAQNENNVSVEAICLLQYFPFWSKSYEMIEPLLTTLKTLLEHKDMKVIRESCYTLMAFARNCNNARMAIIKDKDLCKKLVDLMQNISCSTHPSDDILIPIVGIMATIIPNLNIYRKAFVDNGLLNGVKNIMNCCHCYRRFGCDIIKWLCMTPQCNRLTKPTEIIDSILDCDVMSQLNQIIEMDLNSSTKYSALYAVFMLTYNASYNQMVKLSNQGTLNSLCTQLTSTDNKYVHLVLVTITNFFVVEFMEHLKNQQYPYPLQELGIFAKIIELNNGINLLTLITKRADIEGVKEIGKNKVFAQDLLAYGFKTELRAPRRIPTAVMMDYQMSREDCIICSKTIADTFLFPCDHNVLCRPCASKLLYKILIKEKLNECPICKKEAKLSAAPFGGIRSKMHYINREIEKELNGEFVNEYPPIRKPKVTICSLN